MKIDPSKSTEKTSRCRPGSNRVGWPRIQRRWEEVVARADRAHNLGVVVVLVAERAVYRPPPLATTHSSTGRNGSRSARARAMAIPSGRPVSDVRSTPLAGLTSTAIVAEVADQAQARDGRWDWSGPAPAPRRTPPGRSIATGLPPSTVIAMPSGSGSPSSKGKLGSSAGVPLVLPSPFGWPLLPGSVSIGTGRNSSTRVSSGAWPYRRWR